MNDVRRNDGDDGLSGAYSLDALSAEEKERFELALASSDELRAEAAGFADTAALVGGLDAVTPPPSLKADIFAKIQGLPQLAPQGDDASSVSSESAPVLEPVAEPRAPRAPGRAESEAKRRWFRSPGAVLGLAAASVAAIAGSIVGVNWPGPTGWGAQHELTSIQAAADATTFTSEVAGGGEVTVLWSAELGRAAVMVEGMPQPADGQTYELWFIDDSGAVPAGTFEPGDDGSTWRVLEGENSGSPAIGVTVEPEGGSPAPTTDPIVVVQT
ncbi:anti-sigma factor [Agromyces atrinae]|uniref:anti-sigma factor n=1 Tax=Agromyces atrinae TaxID=592376 RepID=UPI001F584335|nr:anti-sigma factor [Agromyces atrinae]MCI2957936.1 anti-sigma factor [Agromyces atrinae]